MPSSTHCIKSHLDPHPTKFSSFQVTVDSAMEAKIGATAMVLLLLAFGVVGEAKTHEYRSHTFKGVCIHDDLWKYCVRVRSRYDGSSPVRS
nr:uncharacterized protein LOC4328447 [Oryza sativa Japonica Group]